MIMDFVVEKEECVYPMVPSGAPITEMLAGVKSAQRSAFSVQKSPLAPFVKGSLGDSKEDVSLSKSFTINFVLS